jgi:hypothetical protein
MTASRRAPATPLKHGHHSSPSGAPGPASWEGPPQQAPSAIPLTCQEYERLLAGETVSWNQILREHPQLGSITVTHLVNVGAVAVTPDYDVRTDTADFRLRMRELRSFGRPS